jgi:hypothetical protein
VELAVVDNLLVVVAPAVVVPAAAVVVVVDDVLCSNAVPNKQQTNKTERTIVRFDLRVCRCGAEPREKNKKFLVCLILSIAGLSLISIMQILHVIGRHFNPTILLDMINYWSKRVSVILHYETNKQTTEYH